ncbi:probable serine/threonine-protein kinase DDB_G0282963 isoform X2 [Ceratitis capitata]|uniref:probable serine/threonine-protein kinase DDB_G0282963 isoform X2 n=1 Tax=Ceratitis capitata TaxID=7213 RepID=UPI0006188D98|nr:probable serine/threonine-protein kinase DDB_G0282963 isoform X2 [Ceratitis capitata]
MKSSKKLQRQYGNSERKGGSSKREKGSKLDRKSSRGMIYENEELRLRTININAEVERGQSDIKRLRRENEQLRREIWTLRDECDRLNKRFKAKLLDHDHSACNARHSVCSGRGSVHVCDSTCNSDDSDSCDTCKGNDDQCSDECCTGGSCPQLATKQPIIEFAPDTPTALAPHNTDKSTLVAKSVGSNSESAPNLHQAFDHLSVVSEETMSNTELHSHVPHNEMLHVYTNDLGGSQMTLPSLVGPLTPLTPIEQVANQLNDLQAVVPPLSYFENVLQDHMGSNIGNTPNTSSPSSKIMRHTNGWDYKLQSPFAHRKISTGLSPPALQIATPLTMNAAQQPQSRLAPPQLLTTFVPTVVASPVNNEVSPNHTNLNTGAPASAQQQHTTAIETVAITTTPASANLTLNSPKHFFAPLKPRLKLNTALANQAPTTATNVPGEPAASNSTPTTNTVSDAEIANCQNCEPPDLYVHNGLASPYQRQALGEDNAVPPPIPQRGSSSQTESVNLETILNDIQAISEDILAIQLDKRRENDNSNKKLLEQCDKSKKPYRSEMNLTLQYNGANEDTASSNATSVAATATQTSFNSSGNGNGRCTRSLERDHTDSPSPHIPDAMLPFPDKRTYIGFDQLNNEAIQALPPTSVANMQRPPLPPVSSAAVGKTQPPTPPARGFPSPLNTRCAGMARPTPVSIPQPPTEEQQQQAGPQAANSPVSTGLAPNKSQLYTAIANAAAKRAQYRAKATHSLDGELTAVGVAEMNETQAIDAANEALASEVARRKARRVSIVCGDSSTPDSPDTVTNTHLIRSQAQINLSDMQDATNTTNTINSTTTNATTHQAVGSCTDLPSALVNPALRNLKQSSHSTPNSPHSVRRRSNSNTMSPNNSAVDATHPQSLSANTSPRHVVNVHHRHTNSSCSNIAAAHQRKSSQDSTRTNGGELAAADAVPGRSRCSRRHSDGTVASNAQQRVSSTSGHHHHHHHHHQHTSSMLSNNLHHSRHSHQDSTSLSEHGSNSSASSRESSTTFSLRSHRRKISISSHTGGKIPWCGCWGNGCL